LQWPFALPLPFDFPLQALTSGSDGAGAAGAGSAGGGAGSVGVVDVNSRVAVGGGFTVA
jgi:hypothetical protein